MSKITISLCMIVKDESDVIERCLLSVKDAVDEIIIVDTGSTDNTKEIALGLGAKVYDFKWIDDFSEARNYCFSKATMEYILWLDADDVILEDSLTRLIDLKNNFDTSIDSVTMVYVISTDNFGNEMFTLRRNRLVRQASNFKWYGAVHEFLEVRGTVLHSDIKVLHKKLKLATDRNLKIFKKMEDEDRPFTTRDILYYANELYNNRMYDEALKKYDDFLSREDSWVEDRKTALMNTAIIYRMRKQDDDALLTLLKSFKYDAPRADFCCCIGDILLDRRIIDGAIYWYKEASKLIPPEGYLGIMNRSYYTWIPNLQLCVAYFMKGDIESSEFYNEEAAKYIPYDSKVEHNRELFKRLKSRATSK